MTLATNLCPYPLQSMMTVKRWSRGPSATQIGKPAVHMASVDLKGKAFE
jgi:pyrophosphate--fructose-6-phosphate 1-phosphotransferase